MKVLIAEDDPAMGKILQLYFEKAGYAVVVAADGELALNLLCAENFDLAILDWMMPKLDGTQVCRELKHLGSSVKVLLLTAKGRNDDEIEGLKCGADDYLRKPFEPQVLLLRAKNLLGISQLLCCADLTLNPETQKATKAGKDLKLIKKEYELLEFFLRNQGMILSREVLLDRIWGLDYDGDDRTVDTHIKRLRAQIGGNLIVTHRGLGYCMEKQT